MLIGTMNHPEQDVLAEIAWMAEMNMDFIDLTLEPPRAASWSVNPAEIRRDLERHGMRVVGHTAWYLPMASAIEEVRRGALAELCRCIDVFSKVGARLMNIHPDHSTPWHPRSFYIRRNVESLRELVEHGAKRGVGIMVENLPGHFNNAEQLGQLLDPLPDLGLHLDIGHANLQVDSNTTGQILAAYGDRLRHVHLHDNRGGHADLHLPLGTGTVNVRSAVNELWACGFDGTITLEVFTPDRRHLAYSREVLLSAWEQAKGAS